jgi:hypothetical protein
LELVALAASFVGAAFALVRYALNQSRAAMDRFITYLEMALHRQEAINQSFAAAIDRLSLGSQESARLMARIAERLGVEVSS